MRRVVRLTENDLARLVNKIILESEEGDDVIVHYSDSDCDVKMKGIMKQKNVMGDYHNFFIPIEGGFKSFCDKRGYEPRAEQRIDNLEKNYNKYIGKELLLRNFSGFEPGPSSDSFGEEMMVSIKHLLPHSMGVTITKY